ncbi:DNA polymerase IV [Corynebacterium sp. sy039]|uniref:DNA polymerase IV n=1 Tax=Corynebacterium sp. sy039 TaxID=2599641 RepID=UPI0011B77A05|nr:DNA polymerase IV [Corynebacterium sp. sy039]QDZ42908.1 DNA polymerase IV [Corynebacterium sp. sy039]
MQRWVLHIDMDAFFSSCEQLTRPTLRGRPVVVGNTSGRGVVAGASYEARALGAKSAMPMYQAKTLIGMRGVVVLPRFSVYRHLSKQVMAIIAEQGGVLEQLSVDEGFIEPAELAGASVEQVHQWAHDLREKIYSQVGLRASVGAGCGKQYAKISSDLAKPDGIFVMPRKDHATVLYPLPVNKLWGVGPVAQRKLAQLGVATIGDLAALSQKEAEASLGAAVGRTLWSMAQGRDERPVAPRAIAKQISAEYTYPQDLHTKTEVDAAIIRAIQKAHSRLLKDGRGARTISLKLRMADFHIEARSTTLPYATDDYEILKAAAFLLVRYPDQLGPIRLVGVGFSSLETARQEVFFPELDLLNHHSIKESEYEVGVRAQQHNYEDQAEEVLPQSLVRHGRFWTTQDVSHPDYGHGWIQGIGHGRVSVRFETKSTTNSQVKTFDSADPLLTPADPLDSLK